MQANLKLIPTILKWSLFQKTMTFSYRHCCFCWLDTLWIKIHSWEKRLYSI